MVKFGNAIQFKFKADMERCEFTGKKNAQSKKYIGYDKYLLYIITRLQINIYKL